MENPSGIYQREAHHMEMMVGMIHVLQHIATVSLLEEVVVLVAKELMEPV